MLKEPIAHCPIPSCPIADVCAGVLEPKFELDSAIDLFQTIVSEKLGRSSKNQIFCWMKKFQYRGSDIDRVSVMHKISSFIYIPSFFATLNGMVNFYTIDNGRTAVFVGETNEVFFSDKHFDINSLVPHSMSIYCDFIEPTFVGNMQARILKTFPLRKVTEISESLTLEPKHLEFHDLNTRELRSMNFALFDHAGNPLKFKDNKQNIILGLLMKT